MAERPTIQTIDKVEESESSLNSNFSNLADGVEEGLSRSNSTGNQMETSLDMNSQRVRNLPYALAVDEPLTLGQYNDVLQGEWGSGAPLAWPLVGEATTANLDQFIFFDVDGTPNQKYITYADLAAQVSGSIDYSTLDGITVGTKVYPRTQAEEDAGIAEYDAGNLIGDIMFPYYRPGDVRRYGAVEGGESTAAFQAAFNQNVQAAGTGAASIYSPQGIFDISSTITWCGDGSPFIENRTWISDNTTLNAGSNDIDVLVIGTYATSTRMDRGQIVGYVEIKSGLSTGTATGIGCTIRQCGECRFSIGARFFHTGIKLISNISGYGCARNHIHLGWMRSNQYGVWLSPSGNGYTNENCFYGGHFSHTDGDVIQWHIYMPYVSGITNQQPNNNTFYQPALEGGSTTGVAEGGYYDGGYGNNLLFPRIEMKATINQNEVWYTEDSRSCFLFGGMFGKAGETSVGNNNITDLGDTNTIITSDVMLMRNGGTSTTSTHQITRDRPNNDDIPTLWIRDMYAPSQNSMGTLTTLSRPQTNAYYEKYEEAGDVVWNATANSPDWDSGGNPCYECIQAHTVGVTPGASAAESEPGVGTDWELWWRKLNSREAAGNPSSGSYEWSNSGTYVANTTGMTISGESIIYFGDPGTSSISIRSGTGDPNGSVTAASGSLFLSDNGNVYRNTSGGTAWSTT